MSSGNGKPSDSSDEDDELGGDGKLSFHNESLLALSPVVPAVEVLRGYMTSEETVLEYQVANGFSGGTGVGLPTESAIRDVTHEKDLFIRVIKKWDFWSTKEYLDATTGRPVMDLRFTPEAMLGRVKMVGKEIGGGERVLFKANSKTLLSRPKMKATTTAITPSSTTSASAPSGSDLPTSPHVPGSELEIEGGTWRGKRQVRIVRVEDGAVLAVLQRGPKMGGGFIKSRLYRVTVAPGVDLALVVGLSHAWDEVRYYG